MSAPHSCSPGFPQPSCYPSSPQPAKMACLLCIETQDRGAQSVVLIAFFTGWASTCVIFLVLWGLLQEHTTWPDCLSFPFLPNYVYILTALESFCQFPVKIVPYVHIFRCVCWGRWASCPLTLPSLSLPLQHLIGLKPDFYKTEYSLLVSWWINLCPFINRKPILE